MVPWCGAGNRERRHDLAGDEPALLRERIDDLERLGDRVGAIDHDRHHRHVPGELQEPVAVGRVIAA